MISVTVKNPVSGETFTIDGKSMHDLEQEIVNQMNGAIGFSHFSDFHAFAQEIGPSNIEWSSKHEH